MKEQKGTDKKMSKTENIPCNIDAAKRLRVLVVRKYGKIMGYFGPEISRAVNERADKLEQELAES